MAHDKLALAIAKEIPAPFIGRFLDAFGRNSVANANGSGCGNGCGAGCIDGTGFLLDRFGQAGLGKSDLEAALKDGAGLRSAVDAAVTRALK